MISCHRESAERERNRSRPVLAGFEITEARRLHALGAVAWGPEVRAGGGLRRTGTDRAAHFVDPVEVAVAIAPGPAPAAQEGGRVPSGGGKGKQARTQSQLRALIVPGEPRFGTQGDRL